MRGMLLTSVVLALTLTLGEPFFWGGGGWHGLKKSKVVFTVENQLVNTSCAEWFSYTCLISFWEGVKFITIMEKAREVNDHFNFTSKDFGGDLGLSIRCINNLCRDSDAEIYWGIVERFNNGSQCLLPLGVSNYEPRNGQHIVYTYLRLADFYSTPSCDGSPGHG